MVCGAVNMYSLSARLKIPRPFDQWHCSDEVQIELNVFSLQKLKLQYEN